MDRRVAQALVPVDGLPPGDDVARATVFVDGAAAGAATHPFRVKR